MISPPNSSTKIFSVPAAESLPPGIVSEQQTVGINSLRILFVAAPGVGHLLPLVATAWAARCAGHEVLIATTGPSLDMAARSGLPAMEVSDGTATDAYFRGAEAAVAHQRQEGDSSLTWASFRTALVTPRPAQEPASANGAIGSIAEVGERMLPGILATARDWRADVLVYEPYLAVGALAAAAAGIPAVLHGIGLPYPPAVATFAEMTNTLTRLGIPSAPTSPDATIDLCPPSLRPPDATEGWPSRYVPANGGAILPDWLLVPSAPRRVCVTLGSMLPGLSSDQLIHLILDAIPTPDVEVVLVGCEPPARHTHSATVRSANWLPLSSLLPTCHAIVHHGGAGTTFTAAAHGVPQLVLPSVADQPLNAAAVVERGLGLSLSPSRAEAESVATCLDHVLTDAATRAATEQVAAEIAAMPGPEHIPSRLATLVGHCAAKRRLS